jgi:hypothetical protein
MSAKSMRPYVFLGSKGSRNKRCRQWHTTLATYFLPGLDSSTGWIAPALPGAFDAVGTRVTSRPPHRTVRAAFPHTAPTSGV